MVKIPRFKANLWLSVAALFITSCLGFASVDLGQINFVNAVSANASVCNLNQPVQLRRTTKYGIFGDDEFDTVVCGYLVTKEQEIYDEKATIAYLRIVNFADEGLKQSMARGVATGNNVNVVENGNYDLSLGCFQNGRIEDYQEHEQGKVYLPETVHSKILNSSAQQPVALILSFGKHEGGDCVCCNLAHTIRLY